MVKKWVKKVRKRFEVRKFFVGRNRTPSLSEQSADSSEEPTCRPRPNRPFCSDDFIRSYEIIRS